MKKMIAIGLTMAMVLSLTACGSTATTTDTSTESAVTEAATEAVAEATEATTPKEGGHVFGYTCMDMTNPFHIAMRDAMQAAVEANGDTLISIDGKQDQTKQNDVIEDLITQGIEVLFLNPVDSASVQPSLEACEAAGVKVINVDSGVEDTSKIATFISSDNVTAGKQCGEDIVKKYPDGCNICIIENPLADSVVQRVQGLEEAIEGTNCKIIDRKSISTMDVVLQNAEDMLQANADIDVFWGLNDDVSLIILGAVESAGRQDDISVYSVDGSPSGKTSVANGGLYATAAQSPVAIGEKAVECAYDLIDGKTVEATFSLPTTLVTPDNAADMTPDAWN
ncbi:MAG: sugar ABC transporter substrate-binding protein [Lachnospiraceae bacterium]|nr:sugar ABC transporter substrate-binding protein [Lachnospiraceae bacterium]